ncbi:manganese efflux pump MntP family protein [Methanomicrobium antiquum]|uniref:Putative manganese efflux pump MntP n=1 Tax=Methanomicrobium antiquum TaxID=487686 RepID=A0AAF0FWE6_9EURY|nr:manganese efflux pump MntP family protein [Methanomicrobium antiquum]WFN37538.1 manganese efflux pump MntP family protein [Methanomicrobium antiquum]
MNLISVFAIAAGLAMDSFAVSVSSGTTKIKGKFRAAVVIGLVFGFFQGFMPVLGWVLGINFTGFILDYAHWIAFFLLFIIGIKMIEESDEKLIDIQNPYVLLLLGIATSIDALAVGLSFAFLNESVLFPAFIIGIFTFVISFFGVYLGDKLQSSTGRYATFIGGIILILIGVKIVLENSL